MPFLQTRTPSDTQCGGTANWRDLYFAAVLESDQQRALMKIVLARKVLHTRIDELQCCSPESGDEVRDLHCALMYLEILLIHIEEGSLGLHLGATA